MLTVEELGRLCAQNFANCGISIDPTGSDWIFLEEIYGRADCTDTRFARAYAAETERIGKEEQ